MPIIVKKNAVENYSLVALQMPKLVISGPWNPLKLCRPVFSPSVSVQPFQNLKFEGPKIFLIIFSVSLEAQVPLSLNLNKLQQKINCHVDTEMGQQVLHQRGQ